MKQAHVLLAVSVFALVAGVLFFTAVGAAQDPDEEPAPALPAQTPGTGGESSSSANEPSQAFPEGWMSSADPGSAPVSAEGMPEEPAGVDVAASTLASLRIAGSVLRPRASRVEWEYGSGGGCIYASSGNANVVFNAPLYLPQGSTVKSIRMYFDDTDSSSNSQGWFTVYDLYGNLEYEWGVNSSGAAGKSYTTSQEFTHTINYENYAYVVNWRPNALGSSMQLCGFRIYYNPPPGSTYLPLLER